MRLLLKLVFLFMLAQLVGMFVGSTILADMTANPYVQSFVVTQDTQDPANALYFFVYILFGAVIIMLLMRLKLAEIVFRLMEIMLVATSSSIVFYSVLRLAFDFELSMGIGILLGILLAIAKFFLPIFKNLATILATAGVGVIFGVSLGIVPVILFLVLLSIYDYIAVFKTKHMVEMAGFMVKQNLAFTITARETIPETKKEARIDLGSGDMIAPIMLEVSVLPLAPFASFMVFLGASVALFLFLTFVFKKKMVLPALPPIALGMITFLVLGRLIGLY